VNSGKLSVNVAEYAVMKKNIPLPVGTIQIFPLPAGFSTLKKISALYMIHDSKNARIAAG
jgi:hypothetical protein